LNPTKGIERSQTLGGGRNISQNPTKGIERGILFRLCTIQPVTNPTKGIERMKRH